MSARKTLFCVAALAVITACSRKPQQAKPEPVKFPIERTAARLERGRYLVESVATCFDCHSEVDFQARPALPKPGMQGGGQLFPLEGLPMKLYCPNISPDPETGGGTWTDEDYFRALTRGIGHDGRTLFPIMPYPNFSQLPDEDIVSIIVYVRSIPPVHNALPKTVYPEPIKQALKPLPPRPPMPMPDLSDPVKRGAYLVNVAACAACHTPSGPSGEGIPGLEFAGGMTMKGPWGEVAPANLTPDPSGIPYYTEAMFVEAIRTGYQGARKLNNLMPWSMFRGMTDGDLKSIFAYLRTLKPVSHRTDNTEKFGVCKKCGYRHGLGAMN
jgi:mono/diheme cytochrome c family protein